MIHYTREELLSLYNEVGSVPDIVGASLVLRYLRNILLTLFDKEFVNDSDISNNIYEKLKNRAENLFIDPNNLSLRGAPMMGERITVAEFYKKIIFEIPLENMTLFIEGTIPARIVAAWRLKIGK